MRKKLPICMYTRKHNTKHTLHDRRSFSFVTAINDDVVEISKLKMHR